MIQEKQKITKREQFLLDKIPEINEQKSRINLYKQYEFSKKQYPMKQWWQNSLNLYYKQYLQCSMSNFEEIENFFIQGQEKPNGLKNILIELLYEQKYLSLSDQLELYKINQFLEPNNSYQIDIFTKLKNLFGFNKQRISPSDIIIHVDYFIQLYQDCKKKLEQVFQSDLILEQSEFKQRTQEIFITNQNDEAAILFLLRYNKYLFTTIEQNIVFYYLPYENNQEGEFLSAKQILLLKNQIQQIENELIKYEIEIKELTNAAKQFKKNNLIEEAKKSLVNRKLLLQRKEEFQNKKIYILKVIDNLKQVKNNKDFNDVLKVCSSIIGKNQQNIDDIFDHVDNVNIIDNQNKDFDELIKRQVDEIDDKELNSMLEEIETIPKTDKKKLLSKIELSDNEINPLDKVLNEIDDTTSKQNMTVFPKQKKSLDEQISALLKQQIFLIIFFQYLIFLKNHFILWFIINVLRGKRK